MTETTNLVNLDDMRRRLGDDDELIAELFGLFLEEYASQLDALRVAVESRRPDTVRRAAHVIKSSASNLSASPVTEAAGALEDAAERDAVSAFDELFAVVATHVEALADELRERQGAR